MRASGDGASPLTVYFYGDGTLQQADGNYQPANLVRVDDDTLKAFQRAGVDAHFGSQLKKRPRLRPEPGTQDRSDGLDLVFVNRDWSFASANDIEHSGSGQNGHQAITRVKPAKQVTREKR